MTILTISPCKSTADGEFWELEVVGAAPTTETNKSIPVPSAESSLKTGLQHKLRSWRFHTNGRLT